MSQDYILMDDESMNELYSLRTIVLLEIEPQSNRYHQVVLNPERFKAMSSALGEKVHDPDLPEGYSVTKIMRVEDKVIVLPDVKEIYYEG